MNETRKIEGLVCFPTFEDAELWARLKARGPVTVIYRNASGKEACELLPCCEVVERYRVE